VDSITASASPEATEAPTEIGSAAAIVVARAIARGVYEAQALSGAVPAYRDRFGVRAGGPITG